MSRIKPRSSPLGLLLFVLGVPLLIAGCCVGAQFYNVIQGETIARRLLPPEYPGSELINVEQERHPNTRTEQRTYHTPDDMATVLAYMQQYLPGFTQVSGERYENQIEDTGWPSRIVAISGPLNLLESGVPGAAVELDDANVGGTEITFTAYWPDP